MSCCLMTSVTRDRQTQTHDNAGIDLNDNFTNVDADSTSSSKSGGMWNDGGGSAVEMNVIEGRETKAANGAVHDVIDGTETKASNGTVHGDGLTAGRYTAGNSIHPVIIMSHSSSKPGLSLFRLSAAIRHFNFP